MERLNHQLLKCINKLTKRFVPFNPSKLNFVNKTRIIILNIMPINGDKQSN